MTQRLSPPERKSPFLEVGRVLCARLIGLSRRQSERKAPGARYVARAGRRALGVQIRKPDNAGASDPAYLGRADRVIP